MKKALICLLSMAFVLAMGGMVLAGVSGQCANCHTMHYSQNGVAPVDASPGGPFPVLLLGGCLGCHSNSAGITIKTAGNIPVVWNTGGATTDPGTLQTWSGTNYNLAGGNFSYVVNGPSDVKGHNIEDMVAQDATLLNNPPGYNATYDPSTTKWSTTYQLTCAGSNGCHGNRNVDRASYTNSFSASFAGVSGAHHGASTPIDGTTTAKSYRFLGSTVLSAYSVLGLEDPNWQQSASASDHNEYQGALTQDTKTTISYLCGQCHGNFHASGPGGIGTGSPWLRHPTDTDVIAKGGEYANYNDAVGGNAYSLEAPVGYVGAIPAAARTTVTSGNSPVICLSCHRAHASPHDDILRWDYSTMIAGGGGATGTGCFRCHTTKD
ncbi:MAG: cytochrome c3 family protein [Thermodesulfobacteriota bacterium]|nr:cytochrome c3 family protein [Thermodesulfobacteriota bacterium]